MKIRFAKILVPLAMLFAILIFAVGCGGGGGGGSTVNLANQVSLFVTDDLNTGYDHVWVKFYEVKVVTASGTTQVFESTDGVPVDLSALNDGTNSLFTFLGASSFPSEPVTAVKFEMGRDVVLYTTGSTTGQPFQFAPSLNSGTNKSQLTLTLPTPQTVAAGGSLTFDFDLANWNITGGFIVPAVNLFSGPGLDDPARHRSREISGTVGNLQGTAPTQTFELTNREGRVVKVATSADTVMLNENGTPSPTLANGQRVEAHGIFFADTHTFQASKIKIEDGPGASGEARVEGEVRNANLASNHMEVKAQETRGFIPAELWINVTTSTGTKFFNRMGLIITADEFFAALTGGSVEVQGSYDSATNTLTATKAKLEDGTGGDDRQEARGTLITSNAFAGTLSIAMTEWEGFSGTSGGTLNIATNGSTIYRGSTGEPLTQNQFFAAVSSATSIKVEGTYADGTMTAKRLDLRSSSGGGSDSDEAKGTISNVNPVTSAFTLTLVEWEGFNGTFGQNISVTMSASATYRDHDGVTMSKSEFFDAIAAGGLAEVDGLVDGSNMVGVRAKLDDH